MPDHLILRLEGPLQAWGDVAMDQRRPTRGFPSLSGIAGLLASALGWTYRDGARTTALQDSLKLSVREDRPPARLVDFQTVDLGAIPSTGWTRWGVEKRGGAFSSGTHILYKEYLADASFAVGLGVSGSAPASLDDLEEALRRPARPLFLGRKSCPPSRPIVEGRVEADNAFEALRAHPIPPSPWERSKRSDVRIWYAKGAGPDEGPGHEFEVWDRRDFATDRFEGSRRLVEGRLAIDPGAAP